MKETLPPSTLRSLRGRRLRALSGGRDGVALLVVLAFIILLSILVASFLSFSGLDRLSTASYSKSIQAQEVAQGGLQDIIADLHQEIVAGSIPDPNGTTYTVVGATPSGSPTSEATNTIYVPVTNYTAQPARMGYPANSWGTDTTKNTFSPSLVRVSRADPNGGTALDFASAAQAGYYTNPGNPLPANRASQASTGTASANQRYISATRWNKPRLLAYNDASIPNPFYQGGSLPTTSYPNTPDLPDWVYVTRGGSRACTKNDLPNLVPSSTINTVTANAANPVVGRYAYVIYDEGALLDANIAGSPYPAAAGPKTISFTTPNPNPAATAVYTDTSTSNSQAVTGKSYVSYADLNQIPGFKGDSGSVIENFINFRNAGGIASPKNGTGIAYLGAVFNYAKNGFLDFTNGDSPLLNRQDLINYVAKIDPTSSGLAQALPYLGTYSRAVSAPTYTPPFDSKNIVNTDGTPFYQNLNGTSVFDYNSDAENQNNDNPANRDLANVRYSVPGTVTHYFDDQTLATPSSQYLVSVGTPLLQNRFSLARIGWLSGQAIGGSDPTGANPATGTGPSAQFATAIHSCFGLTWGPPGGYSTTAANGGNPCWNYVGSPAGSGGSAAAFNGTIETLDQVAKEAREPNFFELLKAAILNGSLGLGPTQVLFNNYTDNSTFGQGIFNLEYPLNGTDRLGVGGAYSYKLGTLPSAALAPNQIPDVQIIKIGADIIDQYDADSYPTAIYFPYSGSAGFDPVADNVSVIKGQVTMVYGEENLPLISKVVTELCSPDRTGSDTPTDTNDDNSQLLEGWLQPELWNPHIAPLTAPAISAPTSFQVRAYGSAQIFCLLGGNLFNSNESPPSGFVWTPPQGPKPGYSNIPSCESDPEQYYPGLTNGEVSAAGTIEFTDTGFPSIFSKGPRLLTLDNLTGVTVKNPPDAGLGLPPSTTAAGNFALSTFPYYAQSYTNGTTSGLNHFVGFSAGITNLTNSGAPYYSFYVQAGGSDVLMWPAVSGGTSFALGWVDGNKGFHPYSFVTGAEAESEFTFYSDSGHPPDGRVGAVQSAGSEMGANGWGLVDPRTERFSSFAGGFIGGMPNANFTFLPDTVPSDIFTSSGIPSNANFVSPKTTTGDQAGYFPEDWMINSSTPAATQRIASDPRGSSATYYADRDGVVRPGDGIYSNISLGTGIPTFLSAGTSGAYGDKVLSGTDGISSNGRKAVILNRPFRSVGELGYVFRDEPFKTLDFFTPASADAALLDVFSLTDESRVGSYAISSVVAGQVNLSNASTPIVQSLLVGGSKKDFDTTYDLGTEFNTIPPSLSTVLQYGALPEIVSAMNPTGGVPSPLLNRANIVTKLVPSYQSFTVTSGKNVADPKGPNLYADNADAQNKSYIEAPVRAISSVANTRTWNLLIDIIAQSGQMIPNATTLDQFSVQGERRYWLHLAIDRYTGKVVAQQLEPVYE